MPDPEPIKPTLIPESEKDTKSFKAEAKKILYDIKTNYNTKI